MVELSANSGDPDQMPHSAASDLGVHCLPVTVLGISRLQLVKLTFSNSRIRTDGCQKIQDNYVTVSM